jgi:superkiller protein 3
MGKKAKRDVQPRNPTTSRDIDRWIERAAQQLIASDFQSVITTTQRVLRAPAASQQQRVEALDRLGSAYAMLQQFSQAYAVTTAVITLAPDNAMYWFNRGMAARFTARIGRSLRDFERAAELDRDGVLGDKLADELAVARDMVDSSLALRGPGFTLEQLVEQEELFQQAGEAMTEGRWADAEAMFRQVIVMADVLPQPQGNLGLCLMMQRRFDEAEAALRRALEIEPRYTLARQNLAGMPEIRASGKLPQIKVMSPFEGKKMKQTISFLVEGEQG